jgi:hypothetical protein
MISDYTPPVDRLLAYGDAREPKEWRDYVAELGLTGEHVPELIRMATDEELYYSESEDPEVWAHIHAWRALGQLRAAAAAEPLFELFDLIDDEDDDWVADEVPTILAMLGPVSLPLLTRVLVGDSHGLWARIAAARGLVQLAGLHPDARPACVAALTEQLARHEENEPELNASLISDLADLKAVETLPAIREAYQSGGVDFTVMGDFEDVEIAMGVRETRSHPPRYPGIREQMLYGVPTSVREGAVNWSKAGRNDPCPCGSGLKFKKCCLTKGRNAAS